MSEKTFKLGTISMDEDGIWWVHWAGTYKEDGDLKFGPRNIGNRNLNTVFNIVQSDMRNCKAIYLYQIERFKQEKATPEEETTNDTQT